MLGMEHLGMGEEDEGKDIEAKLAVLQEIKDLMDGRLGDKMNPDKGVSVEKVSLMGKDDEGPMGEAMESPEFEKGESEGEMSDEDKQNLMSMYSKLGA